MRSWVFLFSCNLMWALQFTCIKLVQDQVGSLFTVWGPMTLATLMLYPLIRSENRDEYQQKGRSKEDLLLFFLLALVGVFPGQVMVTWGTRISLASNAALLMLTLPVCTAILAYFFLGERMTRIRWLSFVMAIVGVLLCSNFNFGHLDFGLGYFGVWENTFLSRFVTGALLSATAVFYIIPGLMQLANRQRVQDPFASK